MRDSGAVLGEGGERNVQSAGMLRVTGGCMKEKRRAWVQERGDREKKGGKRSMNRICYAKDR